MSGTSPTEVGESLFMLAHGIKLQVPWNIFGIFADSIFPPVIPGKECRCWWRQEKSSCQELHPGRVSARKKKGYELNCMYCSCKQIENMDTSRKHNFGRSGGGREGKSSLFPFSIHEGWHSGEIKAVFDWPVLVWGLSQGISLDSSYSSNKLYFISFSAFSWISSHPWQGMLCQAAGILLRWGSWHLQLLHPHWCIIAPSASLAVSCWREKNKGRQMKEQKEERGKETPGSKFQDKQTERVKGSWALSTEECYRNQPVCLYICSKSTHIKDNLGRGKRRLHAFPGVGKED